MRVDVSDIKLETGTHKSMPVETAIESIDMAGQQIQFDRPFKGEVEIWNIGDDRLLVRGTVSGDALVTCSRCLRDFSLPLDVSFEEEYIEGAPAESEDADDDDDAQSEGDQRTVTYYTGDKIDLSEPLRENVLLEIPMKPLCTEDCKGLCPTCGANLNDGDCHCGHDDGPPKSVDPRLAKLEQLLRKPDSNS